MRRQRLLASAAAACTAVSAGAFVLPGAPAAASTPFVLGTAAGTAQAMQLVPRNGGFAYTITIGGSIADYRGTLAQAQSQTLDLGLIGTSLTAEGCDGSKPTVDRSQLPQPLVAESDHGNATKSADDQGITQSGLLAAAGHKTVSVTTLPAATASFDGGTVGIQGVAVASGMSSEATAKVVPGKSRIATADARIGTLSMLGGLAVFHNLHWTATQQSGAGAQATGTFTIGDATVAGQHFPAGSDAAKTAFDALNSALAQSGLHVTVPAPKKVGTQLVVPPLEIGIDNSALGATVVNPVLTASQPVFEQVEKAVLGFSCKFGTAFTLRDIFLAAVDGTGGLDLKLGGVAAGSDGTSYGNPFGAVELGTSSGAPLPTSSGVSTGGSTTTGAIGGGAAPPPTTAGTAAPPVAAPQVAGATKLASSCATTSPAKWPKCSNGAALAVGLLGLAAVAGVAGGDWLATRRRRRMPALDL
jgi:hypothetical protein